MKYSDLLRSTAGVVFLGTPLRGTETASIAGWVAWIRGFMGKETSTTLLQDLQKNESSLDKLIYDFTKIAISHEFQIRCFYETRSTQIANAALSRRITKFFPNLKVQVCLILVRLRSHFLTVSQQIVSKESACLDGHKRMPLDVRHAMMNKFRGPEDTNFMLVSGYLKEIADNSRIAQSRTKEELKCLQSLTSNYREDKNRCEQRVPGTCEWVLQHPKFLHWRQENKASLLWVSADPGCGKSVLSRSLVDEQLLSLDNKRSSVCYFFFKDDDEARKSGSNALCAILHQLFVQKPVLLKHAMLDYENNGGQLRTMFSTLWEILEKSASDYEAGEIICVLDALDECNESARKDLVKKLCRLYSGRNETNMKLKFLATSRPYEFIERSFYSLGENMLNISLRGEDESEKISKEIDMVIDVRVPHICKNRRYPLQPEVQNALIDRLKNTRNRTYLWLHLIFDVIETSLDSSKIRLERLVQKIPATVDEAYEKLLMRNTDPELAAQARRLLHIIVAAMRPLALHEMNIAMAIDEKLKDEEPFRSYEELELESDMPFQIKIRNICGLFVSIHDSKVYLIHQTAREFLISKTHSPSFFSHENPTRKIWKQSLNHVESNHVLVKICLSYLLLSNLDSSEHTADIISFLTYAAEHWSTHFQKAKIETGNDILKSTLRICDTRSNAFQRWFPAYWKGKKFLHNSTPAANILMIASHLGLEAVVRLLLGMDDIELNCKDSSGRTPLAWAVSEGHIEVVKQLLEKDGVDLNSKDDRGLTPFSWAVEMNHIEIVKMLLEKVEIDINVKNNDGRTPFATALDRIQLEIVKLMLEKDNLDLNSKNGNSGRTPLILALEIEDRTEMIKIVKLLLEKKEIDVNLRDHSGKTPLYRSAATNLEDIEKIKLLLNRTDVDIRSYCRVTGLTALAAAVLQGNLKVANLILEKTDFDTMSPFDSGQVLLYAIQNGHMKMVKSMLEVENVDLNHKGSVHRTLLSVAAESPHFESLELLLKHRKLDLNHKDNDVGKLLPRTARARNYRGVKILIEKNLVTLNGVDEYGLTALSWAATHGSFQIVKFLAQRKEVNLNSKDLTGRTPLSWAAEAGHYNVVELLLNEDKAEYNTPDYFGRTPLSLAAEAGRFEVVELFFKKDGLELNFQNHHSIKSPLWTTEQKNLMLQILEPWENLKPDLTPYEAEIRLLSQQTTNDRLVELKPNSLLLKKLPVDFDYMNYDNQTPMSRAAREGHHKVVKLFREKNGVDLNAMDCHGRTSLSWAAEKGHQEVVKVLLEGKGVELNSKDSEHGLSPLAWAVREGNTDVVELLLSKAGVDLNTMDHHGRTPLSWAAGEGWLMILKLLLENDDVELNSKDIDNGLTPLGWAARNGQVEAIKLLLDQDGVNVNIMDKQGQTPFAWVTRGRNIEAILCFFEKTSVDLNSKDNEGFTPLASAVRSRHGKIIKLLLQRHDVEINTKNNSGRTPLSLAAESGFLEIVKLLLKRDGLEINSRDNDDRTPLSWAIEKRHNGIVKLLREKNAV